MDNSNLKAYASALLIDRPYTTEESFIPPKLIDLAPDFARVINNELNKTITHQEFYLKTLYG